MEDVTEGVVDNTGLDLREVILYMENSPSSAAPMISIR